MLSGDQWLKKMVSSSTRYQPGQDLCLFGHKERQTMFPRTAACLIRSVSLRKVREVRHLPAAPDCTERWGDPPAVHPAPSSKSAPATEKAAGSAGTCCRENSSVAVLPGCGISTASTACPCPRTQPLLLLAVPLFAGWRPQMLSFLQFFPSSFQHVALHWRWELGNQRGHQPHSWSLQRTVITKTRKPVWDSTSIQNCLQGSFTLGLHLPEDGFGFVAGWGSTRWATDIVDSIASRTSRAGLCWLLEYLNSGLGYIF